MAKANVGLKIAVLCGTLALTVFTQNLENVNMD